MDQIREYKRKWKFKFIKNKKIANESNQTKMSNSLKNFETTDIGKKSTISQCLLIDPEIRMNTEIFQSIIKECPEERHNIEIYGQKYKAKRDTFSFLGDYRFSKQDFKAQKIVNEELKNYLMKLTNWVNNDSGKVYNQGLITIYRELNDEIGFHSDDEKCLKENETIYSFSFGCNRRFMVVEKKNSKNKHIFRMTNNSLIKMEGETQLHFKHKVPKLTKREHSNLKGSDITRINITFRILK